MVILLNVLVENQQDTGNYAFRLDDRDVIKFNFKIMNKIIENKIESNTKGRFHFPLQNKITKCCNICIRT